ncbi:Gaa1-like protein [Panaeolus papilionaceus]|nr:Gaa1-like protein [Panaeolus papilionaceus]
MEFEASQPSPRSESLFTRLKSKLRGSGDVNANRVHRRLALKKKLTDKLPKIILFLFAVGYLWMLLIPLPQLGRTAFIDENALQPSQVNTYWDWTDVHIADQYLGQLEQIRDGNYSSKERAEWINMEFLKLGLSSSTQSYSFVSPVVNVTGTNSYAILSSPRHSGTEAMVISASWLSRMDEGNGTINIRGVAFVLALARFLKRYSYWAKDIVFVVSDGYLDGMQAWLRAYHGVQQKGLNYEQLEYSSGVIWTALNIDYPGHSFSNIGIFYEGINGRLPNQDLINSLERIARYTAGVPVTLYDHIDPRENALANIDWDWVPQLLYSNPTIKAYLIRARNIVRQFNYQATGLGSGVHGLFHQYRIDAITIFGVPAQGPHGFHAIGKTVESTLRTMNNMLERLHASFFFYIMAERGWFLKIGHYLPSAIMISVAMMFQGLSKWVDAGWIRNTAPEKGMSTMLWTRRARPVLPVLAIMTFTHILGVALFTLISSPWFVAYTPSTRYTLFSVFAILPVLFSSWAFTLTAPQQAPLSLTLKALNLCFASTVISIIAVLNFSLSASLAIVLGIPLSVSLPDCPTLIRFLQYLTYILLSMGWLLYTTDSVQWAIWNWQVLGVWFAPFVCIVYVPLVLQAAISRFIDF